MTNQDLGYPQDLFILPFDHRGSFEAGLVGVRDGRVTPEQLRELAAFKRIIYDGFLEAIDSGAVPSDTSAILVDQQYGAEILADAHARGITACTCMEKSGLEEFDFEFGSDFLSRLQDAQAAFGKVLVRYNPEGNPQSNAAQRERLRTACDAVHGIGLKFMFELLVPATGEQLEQAGGVVADYDAKVRPGLMAAALSELQEAGIEPDVWKVEGIDEPAPAQAVSAQARTGGRDNVGLIILGRGEDGAKVDHWLTVGAQTPGFIGFAVGRTTFWQPIVQCKEGVISRAEAVSSVAANYARIYNVFTNARNQVH